MQHCDSELKGAVMSARTLAAELSNYLSARGCHELDQPDRESTRLDLAALKRMRADILEQLHHNPQLADEPMFVQARDYLLDEAFCEAGDLGEIDPRSLRRLDALRTHLRQEVRKYLEVDGFARSKPTRSDHAQRSTHANADLSDAPRILVPIDGSQQQWAVQCAGVMARRLSASLLLVHVTPPSPTPVDDRIFDLARNDVQVAQRIFARARRILPADLQVDELVRAGNAADEILHTARDWRADIIVMGTHGRGRIATFLLGSVAEAVVRGAACPVVTVARQPTQAMWRSDGADTDERSAAALDANLVAERAR
jgi:nucleotide-binding universal stress UspA family protein